MAPFAPGRLRGWPRRAVAVLLLAAAGLLVGSGSASAHAVLISTDPVTGSVVDTVPGLVTLTFGESVQLPPNALRVFDQDGIEVDSRHALLTSADGHAVGIGMLPGPALGTYTVAWRVISADTHPVSGAFTFSVGHPSAKAPATAPATGSPTLGLLYGVVRFLAYLGYAAMVGAGALVLLCWPARNPSPTAPRVAALGWATVLLASVATLVLQGPYGEGTGLAGVFEPGATATTLALPLGGALIVRLILLAAGGGYLGHLARHLPTATPRRRRWLTVIGGLYAVGLAATWAVSGHAAVGPWTQLALPLDIAHVVAMAIWLGGLVVLAAELRRSPTETGYRQAMAAVTRRFSATAQVCVAVVVVSGVFQSWRQLGHWSALVDTGYGRILLAKLAAVGVVLGIAGFSHRAVRAEGESSRRNLRRTVLVEAVAGGVVLALTAMLVNAEPARDERATAGPPRMAGNPTAQSYRTVPFHTGGLKGDGTLDVHVAPGRAGQNTIEITVHNLAGAAEDIPELAVELSLPARNLGPLTVAVHRHNRGQFQASGQIPISGDWTLALTVRTSEIDETTVRLPVAVEP